MPAPTTKTLSPAELAKLEHAFATDPGSEAYKPLAEAYLAMGRFMEAMVVCKKGVKAHPATPDPRVLLARVYAEQGKDKKALEEVQGALTVNGADKAALRLVALLQLRGAEADAGKANLLKAYEAAPEDQETLALMAQYKIEAPRKAAPPPPQPVAPPPTNGAHGGPPVLQQVDPAAVQARPQSMPGRPAVAQARAPGPGQSSGQRQAPRPSRPPPPPPRRTQSSDHEEMASDAYEISELSGRKAKRKSGAGRAMFFLLLFTVPLAAGAYYGIGQWKAKQKREANRLLREASEAFKNDTFASYKQGCSLAEKALDYDSDSPQAHAYLAYGYTVRWGEHEKDDAIRGKAEQNLAEVRGKPKDQRPQHFYAAEALFKYYQGKGPEAQKELAENVSKLEADNNRPGLLQLTLGIIQMNLGDLGTAKETLEKAQGSLSDDPRVFVALGTMNRRRGNEMTALNNFNTALKYTKNSHPEALLGTALLVLDQENPAGGYINAAKYIKTLLDSDPPPSSRQLAMGHFMKALLISRVAADIPRYNSPEFKKQLEDGTGISGDAGKARSEVSKEEAAGMSLLPGGDPELLIVRGKRLMWEDNLDAAAAEVNKAIVMNPTMANYYVDLAKVLMRKEGGERPAEEAVRKGRAIVDSPQLMALDGQLLYKMKKVDEARDVLEKAVSDPKARNPEARYLLGRLYRDDKKDYGKAADLLERAGAEYFSDPATAAAVYDELAQTYELKGDKDKDKAKVAYEKSLNADIDYVPTYCHYARFLSKVPNAQQADKDKMANAAKEYVKRDPKGDCAADMQRLAGAP